MTTEQEILEEFNELLNKIVNEKGRSQTFISGKHGIEMEQFLLSSLSKYRQSILEEVLIHKPKEKKKYENMNNYQQLYFYNKAISDWEKEIQKLNSLKIII